MIYKRVAARLKGQDWLAITIELAIVVIGVFIGTQVSNWNAERLEKAETERTIAQLAPNLEALTAFYAHARSYYGTTKRYADIALAGWRGDPTVSDRDFVIAAYQASQILGISNNNSAWPTVLGADQLRRIDNLEIRNELTTLVSADYSQLDTAAVNTPYRQNVRRQIPSDLQDAIRARCGDRRSTDGSGNFLTLPPTCDLRIDPAQAAKAAAILRAHPSLMEDLQWHVAAQAALLDNLTGFEETTADLQRRIGQPTEYRQLRRQG